MSIALIIATTLVIAAATFRTWQVSRDALAPMIVFSPMLFYVYVYAPWAVYASGSWSRFPKLADQLDFVFIGNVLIITAFCFGAAELLAKPASQKRADSERPPTIMLRAGWSDCSKP